MLRFNSMKVRLKHDQLVAAKGADKFQFHEGPIKTNAHCEVDGMVTMFQFHEGPIKTERDTNFQQPTIVSIP